MKPFLRGEKTEGRKQGKKKEKKMALSSTERYLQTTSIETQSVLYLFSPSVARPRTSLYSETVVLVCGPVKTQKALSSEPLSFFRDHSTGRNMFSGTCSFQLCIA